jgi:hypothetical protein
MRIQTLSSVWRIFKICLLRFLEVALPLLASSMLPVAMAVQPRVLPVDLFTAMTLEQAVLILHLEVKMVPATCGMSSVR